MAKNLVIVESPKKISTFKKILGSSYEILASVGHCIDLPEKGLGIDIKKDFESSFVPKDDHKDVLSDIKKAASKADKIILMTDEDREGEGISWNIKNYLQDMKGKIFRGVTNEITAKGINNAINNLRQIDEAKVDAYLTRRLLDRLCGYKTSYLTKIATGGSSAGRVQSAILRIIVDREIEIKNFKTEEYWIISAEFLTEDGKTYIGVLEDKIHVKNEKEATEIYEKVIKGKPVVASIDVKEVNVNPDPPFITFSMLAAAGTFLGWSAHKTMTVAQSLFQGGVITYHRTDSPFIASEAISQIRDYLNHSYSKEYLPSSPKMYQAKSGAQEAHECCRPTDIHANPVLVDDDKKLYELIRKRAIACQMTSGRDERTKIVTAVSGYNFITNGSVVLFDGYRKVWDYGKTKNTNLPKVTTSTKVSIKELTKEQKFTQPPPRYSDVSLVKTCEKEQIARPSTFANFMKTLNDRGYITKQNKAIVPTDLGMNVIDFLKKSNFCFIDIGFTKQMEEWLDNVQDSSKTKLDVLKVFWEKLKNDIENSKKVKIENQKTEYKCPKCSNFLLKKHSKFGSFYSCSKYSKKDESESCDYIAKIGENGEPVEKVKKTIEYADFACNKCNAKMVKREGKFGAFYGCSGFSKGCKVTANLDGVFKEPKKSFKKYKKSKKNEETE